MIYFTIVFLCVAGLFLTLLQDRYRVWTTLGVTALVYLLALGTAFVLRRLVTGPVLAEQLPCAAGCLLFLIASLFLFVNNPLQKLFVALLSLCSFTFLGFFLPLVLGALPFSPAGAFAGVFSVLATCLFYLLTGLCLYRPLRHFSDRGVSGFLVGMCLLLLGLYALSLGKLDFLFRTNIPAARLLAASLLYLAMIFGFRSLYQAGRFREKTAGEAARESLLERRTEDFSDRAAAVREVRAAEKAGEYALDTVNVMLADGYAEKIPAYIAIAKGNSLKNPILGQYHPDPLVNAVIAVKAACAAQNGIEFECNAVTGQVPLPPAELCVICDEMLTRACQDAAGFDGRRKLRFTAFPGDSSLRLEAVYTTAPSQPEAFSLRGKKLSQVLAWLFDDNPAVENQLRGLENTEEIITRHSGKLSVSGTPGETILQANLRF